MNQVFNASCESMSQLADNSVHCVVTSPPYFGLRDYANDGQIGVEKSLAEYVERMVLVFREVRRVLRKDGTCWLNLGDSYASGWAVNRGGRTIIGDGAPPLSRRVNKLAGGFKEKDQMLVPHTIAMALRADGWWLRDTIIWHKPNPMPSSVTDRTTPAHEYVFLLTKSAKYFYDQDAIREPLTASSLARLSQDLENQEGSSRANAGGKINGKMKAVLSPSAAARMERADDTIDRRGRMSPRPGSRTKGVSESDIGARKGDDEFIGANARSVWSIATEGYPGPHFAVMPRELARRCIMAGSPKGGIILDPFAGTGTTLEVAIGCGRRYIGYEINPDYCELIRERLGLFVGEIIA